MIEQPTRQSTAAVIAKPYPWAEEIANSLSHGAGVLFGIFALVLLVLKSVQMDDTMRVVAFTIYGMSVVALFLASTLYHAIPMPRAKQVLKLVDHCAIYLLIAGSYTPFLLLTFGDTFGAVLMVVIWSLAAAGIVFKVFFLHRFHNLSLALYLGMGWLAILASYQLLANLPRTGIALLLGGGILYSLGTIFYKSNRIPFNHAIWHMFVLVGCVLHFLALYFYVLPVG
ncbi:MAG: hemolysin III family protein [Caldilineaceae bacterium]